MAIRYDQIVPWGRSFDEYRRMFALTDGDLAGSILGCADGPADFNRCATERGMRVVSCDPIYRFSAAQLGRRVDEAFDDVLRQTRSHQQNFIWTTIRSVEELGRIRMTAMQGFLHDFGGCGRSGRYVCASLPDLPFEADAFDLALCSHFLFLYSDMLDAGFHERALLELMRVAREVRVFPLLDLNANRSPHLTGVLSRLCSNGLSAEISPVDYQFQRGGNEMLRITRRSTD